MENWLYSTYEIVEGLSAHVDTGEPLPRTCSLCLLCIYMPAIDRRLSDCR